MGPVLRKPGGTSGDFLITFDELEDGGVLFEQQVRGVAAVVQDHVGLPVLGVDAPVDAPPKVLLRLAAPRENREACKTHTSNLSIPTRPFF